MASDATIKRHDAERVIGRGGAKQHALTQRAHEPNSVKGSSMA